jgi:hypothetical protein
MKKKQKYIMGEFLFDKEIRTACNNLNINNFLFDKEIQQIKLLQKNMIFCSITALFFDAWRAKYRLKLILSGYIFGISHYFVHAKV